MARIPIFRSLCLSTLALLTACGEASWECIDLQTDEVISSGVVDCDVFGDAGDQLLLEPWDDCDDELGDVQRCYCTWVDHTCPRGSHLD